MPNSRPISPKSLLAVGRNAAGMWRADRSDPDVARWAALTDLITGEARMGISTENITSVGFDDPGLEPDDGSTDGT